jgi:hypothetical protein
MIDLELECERFVCYRKVKNMNKICKSEAERFQEHIFEIFFVDK